MQMKRSKYRIACVVLAFPLALLIGIVIGTLSAFVAEIYPPEGPHYGDAGSVILFAFVTIAGMVVLPFVMYRIGARWDAVANEVPNEGQDPETRLFFGCALICGLAAVALIVWVILELTIL